VIGAEGTETALPITAVFPTQLTYRVTFGCWLQTGSLAHPCLPPHRAFRATYWYEYGYEWYGYAYQSLWYAYRATMGACQTNPPGGHNLPLGLGKPVFYFPLTNGSLDSWPWATRAGTPLQGQPQWGVTENSQGLDYFPGAMKCTGTGMHVHIDNLLYGRRGSFAINLWIKSAAQRPPGRSPARNVLGGTLFQYVLSHSGVLQPNTSFSVFDRNQVNIYLPAPGRPLFGIARAAIKDSNDDEDSMFVDSDGAVNNNVRRSPLPSAPANVTDGAWHMLTVTTFPETLNSRGFQLYVDGALAGQVPSAFNGEDSESDGGDPIFLDGPLSLCNRADGDANRSFYGYISQLAVIDAALEPEDVKALYDVVVSEDREAMGTSSQPFLAPSGADKEQLLKFRITQPTLYDTTSLSWPQVPDAMFDDVKEQQPSQINSFEPSLVTYDVPEGQYCSLDLAQPNGLTFCAPELVCVPQRLQPTGKEPASAVYPPGVCATPILGVLLPEAFPPKIPVPLSYFPLSTPDLASYPDGAYRSRNFRASLAADTRFGQVLQCNQES